MKILLFFLIEKMDKHIFEHYGISQGC